MRTVEFVEGMTRLLVPAASLKGDAPPTSPVFFNPAASVNRDISVAMTESAGGGSFCDAMAGVGSRGVRIAKEVQKTRGVVLVDFNSEAMKLARRSAALNGMTKKCEFIVGETNSVLFSRLGNDLKFDFVDVDPFGTPVRHLDAAILATASGGILSVTSTDTAALCGVYPKVAQRRYGAVPLNNHFHHETGIRILVNALSRRAASQDIGVSSVAAHATRHYIRVFVRLHRGAGRADLSLAHEGYVACCPGCGTTSATDEKPGNCEGCGRKAKVAGPLWVGGLGEEKTVERAEGVAKRKMFAQASRILRSLVGVDRFPPWSFSIEGICSTLGIATVPEKRVKDLLSDAGFISARQPFEGTGLKTDAPYEEVRTAVRRSRE